MNITAEYLELTQQISDSIAVPQITGLHLPAIVEDVEKPDEFGFIFLADGSAGPFYTSLDNTLKELWSLYPDGKSFTADTADFIKNLESDSPAFRAMALGAFNALSQHVMQAAQYFPGKKEKSNLPQAGDTIGMVGFFAPLVERYIEKGIKVLVLEKTPGRVEMREGVTLSTDLTDLNTCSYILCTASTLINGTLGDILKTCKDSTSFNLIGPSASGLPDVLFKHGVDVVAGIQIHDSQALHKSLDAQESWGHAGNKYDISPQNYPGLKKLLEIIQDDNKI